MYNVIWLLCTYYSSKQRRRRQRQVEQVEVYNTRCIHTITNTNDTCENGCKYQIRSIIVVEFYYYFSKETIKRVFIYCFKLSSSTLTSYIILLRSRGP